MDDSLWGGRDANHPNAGQTPIEGSDRIEGRQNAQSAGESENPMEGLVKLGGTLILLYGGAKLAEGLLGNSNEGPDLNEIEEQILSSP